MARNGVWELEKVLVRYCASGGSSRGVREFVENGLVPFAEKNPQIHFSTMIASGHPCIYGDYITGYRRQRTLKNLKRDDVQGVFQELRDTLGRKVPRHSKISAGVMERKRVSVQGVARNVPNMNVVEEEVADRRDAIRERFAFQGMVGEVGMEGLVDIVQGLVEGVEEERRIAIESMPKGERVLPTE